MRAVIRRSVLHRVQRYVGEPTCGAKARATSASGAQTTGAEQAARPNPQSPKGCSAAGGDQCRNQTTMIAIRAGREGHEASKCLSERLRPSRHACGLPFDFSLVRLSTRGIVQLSGHVTPCCFVMLPHPFQGQRQGEILCGWAPPDRYAWAQHATSRSAG